jgi:SPP1 gp7 family putative phage head morphogenesis protein
MKFKASKKRVKNIPRDDIKYGSPMIPNAGVTEWYYKKLIIHINKMTKETYDEIRSLNKNKTIHSFYAEDSKKTSKQKNIFTRILKALTEKYENIFSFVSKGISEKFVDQVDHTSNASVKVTLKKLSLEPKTEYDKDINSHISASIKSNVNLIKSIPETYFERVEKAVENSLMAEDPARHGLKGLLEEIQGIEGMTKRQAKLIASDQTAKIYSSLNSERMRKNGLEKFQWVHSSAAKTPRHSHVERNGKIFLLKGSDDELFKEDGSDANAGVPKGDIGKPGYAIHCGCRAVAVFDD